MPYDEATADDTCLEPHRNRLSAKADACVEAHSSVGRRRGGTELVKMGREELLMLQLLPRRARSDPLFYHWKGRRQLGRGDPRPLPVSIVSPVS